MTTCEIRYLGTASTLAPELRSRIQCELAATMPRQRVDPYLTAKPHILDDSGHIALAERSGQCVGLMAASDLVTNQHPFTYIETPLVAEDLPTIGLSADVGTVRLAALLAATLSPGCKFKADTGVIFGGGGRISSDFWQNTPLTGDDTINEFFRGEVGDLDRLLCILRTPTPAAKRVLIDALQIPHTQSVRLEITDELTTYDDNDGVHMGSVTLSGGAGLDWLASKSYPYTDGVQLSRSTGEFDGGGQYGVEIPVVNSLEELEGIVKALTVGGQHVTRFNETRGSFLLSDAELSEMFELCRDNGYGILISMGPRPEYDTKSAFYRTGFGLEMGRQINNNDAIRACVEEALRLAALGCRGITLYDIGIMQVLDEMRREGLLPASMVFKTSSHCMATNPFLARIFAANGADSITLAHDLGLPMIQEIRRLNPGLALDVPTDVYKSKGGFIRFYELAEIVQVAAPVMLKMGASVQDHPYDSLNESMTRERVERVARGLQILDQYLPEKTIISRESRHNCVPAATAGQL